MTSTVSVETGGTRRLCRIARHQDGDWTLPPFGIGSAHHQGRCNPRMQFEHIFDFSGAQIDSARHDHIVCAAENGHFRIDDTGITGHQYAAHQRSMNPQTAFMDIDSGEGKRCPHTHAIEVPWGTGADLGCSFGHAPSH